jgi:hypothetical protein
MKNNVNVSIRVEGVGRFDVAVEQEQTKSLYFELVDLLLNRIPREDTYSPELKDVEPDYCGIGHPMSIHTQEALTYDMNQMLTEGIENAEGFGTSIGELCGIERFKKDSQDKQFYKKDYEYFSDRIDADKLVAFECKDCGKVTVRKINLLTDGYTTHCHWCKSEIELGEVTRATFECNCCGTAGYLYVPEGVTEIHCKKCNAPIDLILNKN